MCVQCNPLLHPPLVVVACEGTTKRSKAEAPSCTQYFYRYTCMMISSYMYTIGLCCGLLLHDLTRRGQGRGSLVSQLSLCTKSLCLDEEEQAGEGAGERIPKCHPHSSHLPHCHWALVTLHIQPGQLQLVVMDLWWRDGRGWLGWMTPTLLEHTCTHMYMNNHIIN